MYDVPKRLREASTDLKIAARERPVYVRQCHICELARGSETHHPD